MDIEFRDVPLIEVPLAPEVAIVRGAFDDDQARELMRARVSFGEPQIERLRDDTQPEWAYEVLKFVCSFQLDPDEPFDRAWLRVALSRADGRNDRPPIAWSLAPEREAREVQVERTLSLTPTLTLSAVSVEAGASRTHSYVAEAVHLEALGEQQSQAGWELVHTPQIALRGMHRLAMVVRRDAAAPALARVSLKALVRRKRLGIIPYRATLGDQPTRELRLGDGA